MEEYGFINNFQRIGSVSNASVGERFENAAMAYYAQNGVSLQKPFELAVGVGSYKKDRKFDLGSASDKILVECKSHRWTSDDNVPSAKMTVWNEAMYYFHLVPDEFLRVLFVLRHYSEKRAETLAEYYVRTYLHLIPSGVKIIEFDEETGDVLEFCATP